jgi:hypothetical protein
MAKDVILLGEVAERGARMIEIRCGRCDRRGRLSVARPLAEYGPDVSVGRIMHAQIGERPNKDSAQIQNSCDPYCPDLVRLFLQPRPEAG